jgi:uncharacterized protein (TIGR04222 family)
VKNVDWLFDNPLADMFGPEFLFIYGMFAVIVIGGAASFVRMQDMTGGGRPPATPSDVDPYELAYLRGGANEVVRTAIYALRQQRLIDVVGSGEIKATAGVNGWDVGALERCVFEAIKRSPKIPQLFKDEALRSNVENLCRDYKRRLSAQQLLAPPEVRRASHYALAAGLVLLVALAGYKATAALKHGHSNLGFLIVETIAACFILGWVLQKTAGGNASKLGREYLTQVQLAYSGHVATAFGAPTSRVGGAAMGNAALLLVGLFGFCILKGTPDAALAQQFAASQSGGGDGGGGCGGGGGGGGCGGCGS